MKKAFTTSVMVFVMSAVMVTGLGLSYSFEPPDGYTGAPTESSCAQCHSSALGNGGIELINVPATYLPGTSYTITVSLQDPGQLRWGFELTAIDSDNHGAGTFTVTDIEATQLSDNDGTQPDYLKQTLVGTYLNYADGPVTWSFRWTAPGTSVGAITFYAAGNASDASFSTGGDYIYLVNETALAPTTPTKTPTVTRTPTGTPSQETPTPAPTAAPCEDTGVSLVMPAAQFTESDPCALAAVVCNATGVVFADEKLFVFLEAYGYFYFAPSWTQDLDYYGDQMDFQPGEIILQVIDEFAWPVGAGSGEARFWGALTDPDITAVIGSLGQWDFTWSE